MKPQVLFTIFVFAISLSACNRHKSYRVETVAVRVDSLKQIVPLIDSLVKPILYTNISGLQYLPVSQAKNTFISAVLPSILVARHNVEENKRRVIHLKETQTWRKPDSIFYNNLKSLYHAKNLDDLETKLITLPNSIVLAQAAVESGWGKSRFFLEGSNLFGVWSFSSNEPRMAAAKTRNNKYIYLRAYEDLSESIVHYFEILGRAKPYSPLRKARQKTDNPFLLLKHLKKYSERGSAYTRQLKKIIELNNLTRFDHYRIDPEYICED
jgi:Bax protein